MKFVSKRQVIPGKYDTLPRMLSPLYILNLKYFRRHEKQKHVLFGLLHQDLSALICEYLNVTCEATGNLVLLQSLCEMSFQFVFFALINNTKTRIHVIVSQTAQQHHFRVSVNEGRVQCSDSEICI